MVSKKIKNYLSNLKVYLCSIFFFFFVKHQKSFVMEAYLCSKFNLFDGARITWCVLVHIGVLIKSINYALQNLEEWMSSKKVFLNLSLFFKKKNSHFSFIKNVLYYKLGLIHWYLDRPCRQQLYFSRLQKLCQSLLALSS